MRNKINNLIRRFLLNRIKGFKEIDGFLSEDEALALYFFSRTLNKNSNLLEIGSWKGKSTLCLAKGIKSGMLYVIDPFNADGDVESKEVYFKKLGVKTLKEEFSDNLKKHHQFDKIKICQGYSADFTGLETQFSLIFIDGDHSIEGCEFDFVNFNDKLLKSGFLIFHDYYPDRPELGPTYVINKYILHNENWEVVKIIDSLFVAKKK